MYYLRLEGDHYEMGVKRGKIFNRGQMSFPLQLDEFQFKHGKQSEVQIDMPQKFNFFTECISKDCIFAMKAKRMISPFSKLLKTQQSFKWTLCPKNNLMHYKNRMGIKKEGLSGGKWNENFSFLHLCPKQMQTKLSDISAFKLQNVFLFFFSNVISVQNSSEDF